MIKPLPPAPDRLSGPPALKAWIQQKSVLSVLLSFKNQLGDIYRLPTPTFTLYVLSGPEAARFMLATHRSSFLWRVDNDPVADYLRRGVLMQDGDPHDHLRRKMMPPLQRKNLEGYIPEMVNHTESITAQWENDTAYNMHLEMRKLAITALTGTLFGVDSTHELDWLVPAMIRTLKFISPGLWLFWRRIPRPGYRKYLESIDRYLYALIAQRRTHPTGANDLLSILVKDPEMDDDLIRDQLVTMLIAGHDTITCLLSWVLYFLAEYPKIQSKARDEVDRILGSNPPTSDKIANLVYLDQIIKESLRIYPPIHAGNRITTEDLDFQSYTIPASSRVLFSIFLTHHDDKHWTDPESFSPDRFAPELPTPVPYTYIPFGGGPRNCIGAAYAQVEAQVILARLLQKYQFISMGRHAKPFMGASLDPHPGVWLKIKKR